MKPTTCLVRNLLTHHFRLISWKTVALLMLTSMTVRAAVPVDYVIHISVDGLNAGGLQALMQSHPERHTNFQRLVDEGVSTFNARTDPRNVSTLPGHATMLTGRPVLAPSADQQVHHGFTLNGGIGPSDTLHNLGNRNEPYIASVFDVAHDHGLSTSLYATKEKFSIFEQSYRATTETVGGRPDQYLEDGDHRTDKIDSYVSEVVDEQSSVMITSYLSDMQNDPYNYTFLHMVEPDASGHHFGWLSKEWEDNVALVDVHLGRLLSLVENHPEMRGRTAIVVTADHGGIGMGHTFFDEPNNYTIPFFVWGPNVPAGRDLYEINEFTRANPAELSPSYKTSIQPIRNGDGANLALSLLGLPSIDGSTINVHQDLLINTPQSAFWMGTNDGSGQPGDGVRWNEANNWVRGIENDQQHQPGDSAILPTSETEHGIDLGGHQVVGSLEFHGNITLHGGSIGLAAGELIVHENTARIHGNLSSPLEIIKSGAGTLAINGLVSRLNVAEGILTGDLQVSDDLKVDGILAPGDKDSTTAGTVTVSGNFELSTEGSLRSRITGATVGQGHDQVVARMVVIRGGLDVRSESAYVAPTDPGEFDRFALVVGRRVGAFREITYDGVPQLPAEFIGSDGVSFRNHVGDGLFRIFDYEKNEFSVTNYRAIPGDANGDGIFDSADLVQLFKSTIYQDGDNDNADWVSGDWNGDKDFDSTDLITALQHSGFERESVFVEGATSVVPEALPLCVPTGCFIGILHRRRLSQLKPATTKA